LLLVSEIRQANYLVIVCTCNAGPDHRDFKGVSFAAFTLHDHRQNSSDNVLHFLMLSSNPPQARDVGSAIPVTLPLNLIAIDAFLLKDAAGHHRAPNHHASIHPGNCSAQGD